MASDSLEFLEEQWAAHEPSDDERFLPFLPYDLNRFRDYLERTLALFTPKRFVDIGCGIGTKLLLVQRERGIPVFGIDRVPRYVAEARSLGVHAEVADAFEWDGYQAGDLVYMYRPCEHWDDQLSLERVIRERLKRGSVLWLIHGEERLSEWHELWSDWIDRNGAWSKP